FARRRGLDERLAELLGERLVAAGSFQECPARLGAVIVVPGLPRLREELARVTRVDTPLGVAALDRLLGIHENSEVRALVGRLFFVYARFARTHRAGARQGSTVHIVPCRWEATAASLFPAG